MDKHEQIAIIDGSAPFFAPYVNGRRQNWSKAPLQNLIRSGVVDDIDSQYILKQLKRYLKEVASAGFTAITFDDLAHITLFDFYPYALSRTVRSCQDFFMKLFAEVKESGLQIYITTDLLFWNTYIEQACQFSDKKMRALFAESLSRLFDLFPMVSGVVIRIGESDGVDVKSLFKSRMVIRTPEQCNRWIRETLPLFELHNKTMIFRTWGLGAFPVGDLIWNEKTEAVAFRDITSPNFIVSRKFAPADFFRYLELSERIITSPHPQIVELQARREYEGFGEFPAWVGNQYEKFRDQLSNLSTMRGISVWCQTGGWSHFDRLTFLKGGSLWNKLNAVTTIELFTTTKNAKEIRLQFLKHHFPKSDRAVVEEVIDLFDSCIDQLWYIKPFAEQEIWFRRLRVPPLLWIFWDTILVNPAIRMVFRTLIPNHESVIVADDLLVPVIKRIKELANSVDSYSEELIRGADTIKLLIAIRKFYFGKGGKNVEYKLQRRIEQYRQKHPKGFLVEYDFSPFRLRWITEGVLFSLLLRNTSRYRLFDRLLLIPLSSWLFPLIKRSQKNRIPELANRQAVGLELFFR